MNIFKVDKYDVNNGPGVRTSIWTSGCKHHCKGCWAADTWNPNIGKPLEEWLEIIEEYLKDPKIDGVSILGGDPLYETMELGDRNDLDHLLNVCKVHNKNVWLWTGYKYEDIPEFLRLKCDVIVDGKFVKSLKDTSLKWRGSSNQRIIKVK